MWTSMQSGLTLTRRLSAAAGIALLVALAFLPEGSTSDRLALTALVALGLAAGWGWLELIVEGRPSGYGAPLGKTTSRRSWLFATLAIVAVAGVAVQTWVEPRATIAGGDVVVPNGI